MNDIKINVNVSGTVGDLQLKIVETTGDATPYGDCDHEGIESILKKLIVDLGDGTYALRVHIPSSVPVLVDSPGPTFITITTDGLTNPVTWYIIALYVSAGETERSLFSPETSFTRNDDDTSNLVAIFPSDIPAWASSVFIFMGTTPGVYTDFATVTTDAQDIFGTIVSDPATIATISALPVHQE